MWADISSKDHFPEIEMMHRIICLILICLCVNMNAEGQTIKFNNLMVTNQSERPDYDAMSCRDLYKEATLLEPRTQHVRSPILNEETDLFTSVIGTVFQPALYYQGFYVPWHFREEYRIHKTSSLLDSIRQRMAYLHCFEK